MKKEKIKRYFLLSIIICILILPIAYSRYAQTINRTITLNITSIRYRVDFYSNRNDGNPDDVVSQTFACGVREALQKNTFTKSDYNFVGWTTAADGTGTFYEDEQEVEDLSTTDGDVINLYAKWVQGVAEVNGVYYMKLQTAIDNVPKNNTQTVVKLLTNTSENIVVAKDQNIIFNLQNYTVSDPGTGAVLTNNGTIQIYNGSIESSSVTDGAVNNNSTGKMTISGGSIKMLNPKGKQAIYNDKGTVVITGDAYISSASSTAAGKNIRATVQNQSGGTLTITGGTIVSEAFNGITNAGTMTIGTKDGTIDKTTPIVQAAGIGVNSTSNFKFYDGTMKGGTNPIANETKITDKEAGYEIAHSEETIDGVTYKTAYLAMTKTVTFDANTGTVDEPTRKVEVGKPIGTLPVPEKMGHRFDGWFTLAEGGQQIDKNTIVTDNVTYYAHWTQTAVAEINGTQYLSLKSAINAAPDNVETTITVLMDIKENVTVPVTKNIVLDIGSYKITNSASNAVITNKGKVKIISGTIRQTCAYAAINNNAAGEVIMTGGRIESVGERSAIYCTENAKVTISGDAYLTCNASDFATTGSELFERGTIMSISRTSDITITGGTIVATAGLGVSSPGPVTIGVKEDGVISTTSPSITAYTSGVKATGTLNYYDGIIKGITSCIDGTITDQEPNTHEVNGTEVIGGNTYNTKYLESD